MIESPELRILSGVFKNRILRYPLQATTRPTKHRIRQAIFNQLRARRGDDFLQVCALDAFAGSGSLGFELLSLGAEQVVFVEKETRAVRFLHENAQQLGVNAPILHMDFAEFRWPDRFDIVFLDPPYGQDLIPRALIHLRKNQLLQVEALVILECLAAEWPVLKESCVAERFALVSVHTYGKIAVVFLQAGIMEA